MQSLAEEATTANGNAEANQEKYMESTAGKLQAIKTQMQDFWVNFYNSGTVNGVLEFVHSLTEGFTSLGKNTWTNTGITYCCICSNDSKKCNNGRIKIPEWWRSCNSRRLTQKSKGYTLFSDF